MIEISSDERALIEQLNSQPFVYLDPSDAGQRKLITHFLEAAGKDASRYPALHAAVAAGAPAAPSPLDNCTLIDLGRTAGGKATARAWLASRGGAYISGAHTAVLDAGSGETLAAGGATQVGSTLVQAATTGNDAKAAAERQTVVTFFHAQQSPDTPPRFGLATTTREDADLAGFTIGSADPSPWNSKNPQTCIALCRISVDPSFDYVYPGADGAVDPDRLVVPFTGSAGPTPYPIQKVTSVSTMLYVTAPKTAWVAPRGDYDLYAPSRLVVAGNTLSWAYKDPGTPPEGTGAPQPINLTNSIQYEATSQANDWITAFFGQFTVQLTAGPPVTFTVCSSDWPDEPSVNCAVIAPLFFWWHCLAADSMITLPDGSTAAVGTLNERSAVRGVATGEAVDVIATTRAFHGDNDGRDPALRLETEGKRSLVLSGGHPVLTTRGPVAARDLGVGAEVVVEGGTDRVTSCTPISYDGLVCNLELGDRGPDGFGAFFANGIAVGDQTALTDHFHTTRHDPDHVLARLPETHHQDYLSALADATAR